MSLEVILLFLTMVLALAGVFRTVSSVGIVPVVRLVTGVLAVYAALLAALWLECTPWLLLGVAIAASLASLAIQGEGLSRLTHALGRLRLPLYLLSTAAMAALLLLFVPVATYLTSPGELGIPLSELLWGNACQAMLAVYVAALFYMLAFTSRMRTLLTLLVVTALALSIVYTFALPFGYPPMSGLAFEQIPLPGSVLAWRALVDVALLSAVASTVCALIVRFGARPLIVASVLMNVSLGGVIVLRASQDRVGEAGGATADAQLPAQPLRFSSTKPNVLILFLDRFMGSYVESIVQSDPDLLERLDGFTWYPRTVSAGHNSIAGVHPMLGGYDYTPVEMNARGRSLRELSIEAFSILPHNFASHGYHVNLVSPRGLGFTMAGDCGALKINGVTCTHFPLTTVRQRAQRMGFTFDDLAKAGYADLLSLLSSMRGAPYLVKHVIYEKAQWRPFMDSSAGTTFREWAQLQALPEVTRFDAEESNLNFVSSLLAHEPSFLGEDCQPRHELFKVPDEEFARRGHTSLYSLWHAIGARCTLLSVADYLDVLKQAGVYDNTKIVIVSDHGIVGRITDRSTRAVAGGTTDARYVATRSVLLVKERNARGRLQTLEDFLPNAEVPRILCEEIGGCVNPYLNDKRIAADGRDDPFYVSIVPWQFSAQQAESFVIQEQRVLKGKDPYDVKGWTTLE
ncbi:alkaline phosphatase family protein [Peristeroidobacter soli]|uniref:hypothetical protein n=1 Tax=Peristeroidobacter soli TaxID=2497877 RepID=UPI00101BFD98|nr:hypothetical protein [Peristeroidobacter soli]